MREVHGETLGLEPPLERGGHPPLVLDDKYSHVAILLFRP